MSLRVAIVGAGIGGLAAALFLRRAGIEAQVYEQATQLRETGAGIVVPPNMVRLLSALGLTQALQRTAVQLQAAWEFRRWQDGRVLFVQPMGDDCERLYGAHCFVAHRADLLALLQEALPASQRVLGQRYTDHRDTGAGVEITFERRSGQCSTVVADTLIGADGIRSLVRTALAPDKPAQFSGRCAFRCLVPAVQAPAMALRPVQTLWLGPGRHLVHYPVSAGRLVNIVAIVPAGDWRSESWTDEGRVADMQSAFIGWDDSLQQLMSAATDTRRWALYDRLPLPRWSAGCVSLLGDAAHPMLPFFAQGAAQAVEDAAVLASCLASATPATVLQALQRYEARRRPRASEVQLSSKCGSATLLDPRGGRPASAGLGALMSRGRELRNHLPDSPEQQSRDQAFAQGDPLRQSAWLYGHDVLAESAEG